MSFSFALIAELRRRKLASTPSPKPPADKRFEDRGAAAPMKDLSFTHLTPEGFAKVQRFLRDRDADSRRKATASGERRASSAREVTEASMTPGERLVAWARTQGRALEREDEGSERNAQHTRPADRLLAILKRRGRA